MIYLDNAATTSPKPESVIQTVKEAMRRYSANPGRGGHMPSLRTSEAVYAVRSAVRGFFDMQSEEKVIFTSGCTQALNTVIKGVLKQGDHVIISSLEHNAVLRPIYALKQSGMIDYSIAEVKPGDDEATLDAFRDAINSRTRLMICTHASNVFGIRLPVERLCALAHSYGILFCVDAAQTAGVLPIDMQKDGYDFVCCAGHKGLYGPTGVGLLLIGCDEMLDPLIQGGTGSESIDPMMPEYYPDRLESGTLNIPGICGLGGGIRFIRQKGVQTTSQKEMKWIQSLYRQLSSIEKVILYTAKPDLDDFVPVLSFNIKGSDSETTAAFLNRRYAIATRAGLHCAPLAHRMMGTIDIGTVRIAPSAFTTETEQKILVKAIKNFIRFS